MLFILFGYGFAFPLKPFFNLFRSTPPYLQETVCSGVKRKLMQNFPHSTIPTIHFCVHCKGTKEQRDEEECQFKGIFSLFSDGHQPNSPQDSTVTWFMTQGCEKIWRFCIIFFCAREKDCTYTSPALTCNSASCGTSQTAISYVTQWLRQHLCYRRKDLIENGSRCILIPFVYHLCS